MIVLVTGGARSGKSTFAERYSHSLGKNGIYVATAESWDDEMKDRVKRHQIRRDESGFQWRTQEETLCLPERLESIDFEYNVYRSGSTVVLVDCLTLWLTNLLLQWENEPDAEQRCMQRVGELTDVLRRFQGDAVLVTNEVGYGIVPATPLGRKFRDICGRMNQEVAAAADQVFLVTVGIPIELKSRQFKW
ncbi:bifunctional adenosylcobinamide kinase/adenosylcobinamide-phosphate guanylyltransferase [Paenibacillus thermotolerans]|uniref:bifunctional adenosylcobinamide kinase/adenosylcobinamide-phosphate guanylyltransferase n=1 Tax=Paenibacillus thermotolerans TaxID=3027807 RepID=UPI0023675316|nr:MULTISPECIES: bifunctional adenosylcobinamide kinase/adenosylcobinamide-phosphate guanylyltransferase [unclassified Paenibacillus]